MMFLSTLMMSTILIISSTNWILLWMFMEINLMAMIPLIAGPNSPSEAPTKYFLIQSVGSMTMVTMIIILSYIPTAPFASWLLISSLLLKMGMAPLHTWLPQIINNLQWPMIFLLITWQKIGPLMMLSSIMHIWSPALNILIILNALIGAMGGLNQTKIRPLIAYSSIAHSAWLMASMIIAPSLTLTYFTLYSILNAVIILPLFLMMKTSTSTHTLTSSTKTMSAAWMLNFLSLAGMPPLLGFFPKWLVILSISKYSMFIAWILIVSSMITLLFYLNIFTAALLAPYSKTMARPVPSTLLTLPMITLPIFPLMFLI